MKNLLPIILVIITFTPSFAFACSKSMKFDENGNPVAENPTDYLAKAKYIFRGLAYKTEIVELEDKTLEETAGLHYIKVYFKPIEVFKGNVRSESYAISYNGYLGGCAAPVLVGLEYLVATPEIQIDSDFSTTSVNLFENSIGMLDIFNTKALPAYKPKLEEAMTQVREWSKANLK